MKHSEKSDGGTPHHAPFATTIEKENTNMKLRYLTVLVIALFAHTASAGLYYSAVNTTEEGGSKAADWRVSGWIDGDNAKVQFQSSGNPLMPEDSYLLTNDGGQNVFLVDPADGSYSRWDLDALMQGLANGLDQTQGLLSITIENPKVELLVEEAGGTLAGRPTTHYRYRTSYESKVKIMGMTRGQAVVNEQDIWSTDSISDPGFGIWLRKAPPSFGDNGLDELVKAEMQKMKGFPLKSITESVSEGKKGKQVTTRMVMEVTELREESIPAATFVLDPDLVEKPMTFTAPEAEGDQPKGGLRGLLKRRSNDDG
jgi:hypothetical protein